MDLDAENLPRARERLTEVGHPFHLHHGNFAGIAQALGDGRFAIGVKFLDGPVKWTAVTRIADGLPGRALAKTAST